MLDTTQATSHLAILTRLIKAILQCEDLSIAILLNAAKTTLDLQQRFKIVFLATGCTNFGVRITINNLYRLSIELRIFD